MTDGASVTLPPMGSRSLASAVAAGLLAITLSAPARGAKPEPEPLVVGEPAPAFSMRVTNPALAGLQQFALQRYVGPSPAEPKKAVVLSFAASYCEPCKRELAELGALKPRLEQAGVLLVVVVIDTEAEGIEQMRRLTVDELKLPYAVLQDRFGVVAKRYRALSLPFTVVVGPSGNVSWLHSGFQAGSIEALAKQLGV